MLEKTFSIPLGEKDIIVKTGKLAKQASGACTIQYGGTVVLVTACVSNERKDTDFFPLTVEYQAKTYAAGKIPGGFFKREGKPSEKEILSARLIDRPIRPLFPEGMRNEVQVIALVLSHDGENDPDILAVMGASVALSISEIPFLAPLCVARIAENNGTFILNPTYAQLEKSSMEIVLVAHHEGIVMLEAGAKEVSNEMLVKAFDWGWKQAMPFITLQEKMMKEVGKKKLQPVLHIPDNELLKQVKANVLPSLKTINQLSSKEAREEGMATILNDLIEKLNIGTPDVPYTESDLKDALTEVEKQEVRSYILTHKKRIDGRDCKEVRPITCEVGVLPRTHGSGLFTRGQTQSLAVATLGTSADEQLIDALEGESLKSFMLHYSFPPFSVGETRPMRGPGRREIGHGALAERALTPLMPTKEEFPYTVRVVSEILESNGSSSMATVCAGTLCLMDAGVPIKKPVAGVAMGLVKDKHDVAILTDISGLEDHFGDMDFKLTGTKDGVTAIQLDVKISEGLTLDLISKITVQAWEARLLVLEKIQGVLACPRKELSEYAPRIVIIKINPEKIKDVIGPGGKIIKKIIEDTNATIDIENDGTVKIASVNPENLQKALKIVQDLTAEVEVGKIYHGTVKRILNFGAFIEVLPGKEGLCHISELADKFVAKVDDVVKIGQEVTVKVIEIDAQGRVNLSIKQAVDKK